MDHFGIGAAMESMARVYCQTARRTGRTTSLVESVKNGDRIIFMDPREAERVRRLLKERGVDAECIVFDPKRNPGELLERGSLAGEGRAIFDHSWVEQWFIGSIARAAHDLDHLERAMSGYGAKHRETKRRAVELSKWR